MTDSGGFIVYLAQANEIPAIMHEVGVQREIAFRSVGEGTGKSLDLDEYDNYYYHLLLWNQDTNELVGGYRLGPADIILDKYGIKGLYTSTLFNFDEKLISMINPSVELGRSFIRKEYQRNYSPLMLLWKGIGQFVVRNPQYRNLFGPVSISNSYATTSKEMMVSFLEANHLNENLAGNVSPRNPMTFCASEDGECLESCLSGVKTLEELDKLIKQREGGIRSIPILVKQYLQMGGKMLGFNIDPDFNDSLDAMVLVDLVTTEPRLLRRYLGNEGTESFLKYHGVDAKE
jgi:putative hemolysin